MSNDVETRRPEIVGPVSCSLAVADLGRSKAFYHDVLGFQPSTDPETEDNGAAFTLVCGPARIEIRRGPDSSSRRVLFFETSDVDAMRHLISRHGGSPSEVERVNWIKMRMFEVRDPDNHPLWFGQSFHQTPNEMHTPPGTGQLRQIMPAMPLSDVAAGVAHYRDVLGFTINYSQHDLGVMDRDSVRILLVARKTRSSGIGSCYVYVRDADALHSELTAKGARVQGTPVSHPWGLRDFCCLDLEGNEITFGQPFE
jgi:predicted enzyme related to lactoylglutathione lyase